MPSNNSRSPSPELHFCRWGFACTESFPSAIRLLQHVILDHVRTAVPVYRHEIPTLLRTTEGIGESYETEHFLSLPEQRQDISQQVKNPNEDSQNSAPAASLPSPPTSLSPRLHENDEDRDSGFSGSDSEDHKEAHSPNLYVSDEDIDILGQAANVLLSDTLEPPSPGFVSLATSTGSPRPGAIPPSPTFSDIIASSTQKSSTRTVPRRLILPTVSQSSTSTSNSCAAVEAQLTPIDEEYSIDDDVALPSQSQVLAAAGSGDSKIYEGEPQRISRFPAIQPQPTFDSQDGSDSVDDLSDAEKTHVFRYLISSLLEMSSSDLDSVATDHRIQRAQQEKMLELFASHTCTLRCVVHKNDAISAGILHHCESVVARDYGHTLPQQPSSQAPPQNTTPNQHSVPSRQPSFGVPITTRKQSWYGVRSRKRSRGDGFSPLESPVDLASLSPVQTTRSKLSVNPNASYKINDNTSESSPHRKRYKLDSLPEHNTIKIRSDNARHHSTSPECDADVSQMQVETQLTMSPSQSSQQEPYDKQYELYGYALQTQPHYDSQQ